MDKNDNCVVNHLNIIQNIISRMNQNSINCKTWCVTIASAILLLIADKNKPDFLWIIFIPIVSFLILDALYLGLEKSFRESYNSFVGKLSNNSVDIKDVYVINKPSYSFVLKSFISFSIYGFYGIFILIIFLVKFLVF